MESELYGVVNVWCSEISCKFKNNHLYYGLCHNPEVLQQYKMFAGGDVHISGCGRCSACTKEQCPLSEYIVKEE